MLHSRGFQHPEGFRKGQEDIMHQHRMKFHPETNKDFKDFRMKMEAGFSRPALRQCHEEVSIERAIGAREAWGQN